jgi:hypothetical protein
LEERGEIRTAAAAMQPRILLHKLDAFNGHGKTWQYSRALRASIVRGSEFPLGKVRKIRTDAATMRPRELCFTLLTAAAHLAVPREPDATAASRGWSCRMHI